MIYNPHEEQGAEDSEGSVSSANDIRLTRTVVLPRSAVRFRFARSSGPGGQNVNKVATKVEVICDIAQLRGLTDPFRSHLLGELAGRLDRRGMLRLSESGSRSQWSNRERALSRLIEILREAVKVPVKRTPTSPTGSSRMNRVSAKIRRGKVKTLRRRVQNEE